MISKLARRIRAFFAMSRLNREFDEEMQFHIARLADEMRNQGYDAREARRRALIQFGAVNSLRDEARDAWGWRWLDVLMRDIGFGVRALRKRPVFTLVAVISLAIGIGANTAIFSIVNAVMLKELPYKNPDELVDVRLQLPDLLFPTMSYPDFADVRAESSDAFSGMIASQPASLSVDESTGEVDVFGEVVTGDYFSVLGITAEVGRLIEPGDDEAQGAQPVIVLSHAYWESRFGGDAGVVGTELRVEGRLFTIIGVAPVDYPGILRGIVRPSIYAPMAMLNELVPGDLLNARDNHNLFVKGRLKPGVSLSRATAVVESVSASLSEARPIGWDPAGTLVLAPTGDTLFVPELDGRIRSTGWLLMIVVSLLLLVVCVNLAGFLMARAIDRRRDVAMQVALGASRGALVRRLLTETVLLCVLGGVAGIGLATLLLTMAPAIDFGLPIPFNADVAPDARVLGYSSGVCLLAAALLGLVPALGNSRPNVALALRSDSGGANRSGRLHLRNVLVIAQLSVAVVLLVGTSLVLRSFERQRGVDPGFGQVTTAAISVEVPATRFSVEEGRLYVQRLRETFSALPGVDSVGIINTLPLTVGRSWIDMLIDGHEPPPDQETFRADYAIAGPGYFESIGIPIIEGRAFNDSDRTDGERVAIVSAALAESFWPNSSAVGKVMHVVGGSPALPEPVADLRIVGVARDSAWESLEESPRHLVYVPYSQFYSHFVVFLARTSANDDQTALSLMSSGRAIDPDLAARAPTTISRYLESQFRTAALMAMIVTLFSMLVLVLATVGLYGVVSYAVATRTREVGVRMALGADATAVRRLLTLDGVRLVAIGGALGLVLSIPVNRILSTFLADIARFDLVSFAGATAVLFLTAVVAAYLPARRASEVNPVAALRTD